MAITIGIDLGTTNSVICIKKINVATIRNAEGEELTPSCVTAIPRPGNPFDWVVGRGARNLLKQYPQQTITSVKRLMGRDFEDPEVQTIINDHRVGYHIITDVSEPGSIRIPIGGKMQTPEMISGMILSKLIHDGEAELQGKIDQAVVTVPAYFSDRQKFATRAACDYAGIKLLRLLSEPTAAALSFGLEELDKNKNESRTLMVFDLGGGTFDISILSFAGGSFMEVTKGGDMWLGGDNIDRLLVDHVFSCTQKTAHCPPIPTLIDRLSPADRARFMVEITEKAEAAKIALSTQDQATVDLFGLLKDEKKQLIDIDVTITRAEFARLLDPIVKRVSGMAKQTLYEIRFEPELIDTVLMVGGSSLVPAIQDELKTLFGKEKVMVHPRPMLAIAEGAALMAAKMTSRENVNESDTFSMMHSTAQDYYLQLAGGKKHLLVARNTPLPVNVEQKLSFSHSQQSLARLRVFNEVDGVLDTVGELWFHPEGDGTGFRTNNKPGELMLRFSVDEDNIITLKAWSLQNKQVSVETQIARGGLAAKLYADLERTLSLMVANSRSVQVEHDVLRLSRTIVTTILSASDPVTGETRLEQKQKAQRQINTLQGYQQKNLTPLSRYQFALVAQAVTASLLSPEEKSRLNRLLEELKQALEDLADPAVMERLEEKFDKWYEDIPIAADLARAENIIALLEKDYPGEAKQIRHQANQLRHLYRHPNPSLFKEARGQLHAYFSNISWDDTPTRRFDRDVCL